MKFFHICKLAAAVAVAASTLPASAVTTYTFDNGGSAFATPGTYGTVTLTQNGANVDVSVVLAAGYNFVETGNNNSHSAFSFNASNVVLGDITNIVVAGGGAFAAIAPSANSPFGSFGFGIDCAACQQGGAGQQADPMTFTVMNALESDFAFLSSGGSPNAYFAADIITGSTTGAVGVTGNPVPGVPEPETYALMLAGLGVVGFMARRRKQQA